MVEVERDGEREGPSLKSLDSNSSSGFLAVRSWAPDSILSLISTVRAIALTQGPSQGPVPHSENEESLRDPA